MSVCENVISIFKLCDTKNVGTISVDSFKTLLLSLNDDNWSQSKVDQLLDAFGLGSASAIRYEEFFRWLFSELPADSLQESQCVVLIATSSPPIEPSTAVPSLEYRNAYKAPLPPPAIDTTTPLGEALSLPDTRERALAVEQLLKAKPEIATKVDAQGKFPLHVALRSGQPRDVVKLLLNAYPNAASAPDKYGLLPLHVGLSTGSIGYDTIADVLEAFAGAAGFEDKVSGMLPLHSALVHNAPGLPVELIKDLLDAYPPGILTKSPSGDTPMRLAMHFDRGSAVMEELLKAAWKAKLSN